MFWKCRIKEPRKRLLLRGACSPRRWRLLRNEFRKHITPFFQTLLHTPLPAFLIEVIIPASECVCVTRLQDDDTYAGSKVISSCFGYVIVAFIKVVWGGGGAISQGAYLYTRILYIGLHISWRIDPASFVWRNFHLQRNLFLYYPFLCTAW